MYFIMVESLQNIIKHQDERNYGSADQSGIFLIQKRGQKYYITSGNLIENKNIDPLRGKLERINNLDPEDLKIYYLQMLKEGEISDKGGAGLGLIEIAKKSGNKLAFEFRQLDTVYSYFYLQTVINSEVSLINEHILENGFTIVDIKNIHNLLNEASVQLIFRGVLNQETLINLLSIIRAQLTEEIMKKRTISLIIELLQNIVKHGYNAFENNEENSGIFIISKKGERYHLYTGNYIENDKKDILQTRIEIINELNQDELSEIYNKGLYEQEEKFNSNAGLGLIKLKLKTKEPFRFDFFELNDRFSFFTFEIVI